MKILSRQLEPDWAAVSAVLNDHLQEVQAALTLLLDQVAKLNPMVALPGQQLLINPDVQTTLMSAIQMTQQHACTGIEKAAAVLKGDTP